MYIEQAKNAKWCTKDPLFVISRNQLLQLVQKGKTFFFLLFHSRCPVVSQIYRSSHTYMKNNNTCTFKVKCHTMILNRKILFKNRLDSFQRDCSSLKYEMRGNEKGFLGVNIVEMIKTWLVPVVMNTPGDPTQQKDLVTYHIQF